MNDELKEAGQKFDKRLNATIRRIDEAKAIHYKKTGYLWTR
jgi:hypothetical protein